MILYFRLWAGEPHETSKPYATRGSQVAHHCCILLLLIWINCKKIKIIYKKWDVIIQSTISLKLVSFLIQLIVRDDSYHSLSPQTIAIDTKPAPYCKPSEDFSSPFIRNCLIDWLRIRVPNYQASASPIYEETPSCVGGRHETRASLLSK